MEALARLMEEINGLVVGYEDLVELMTVALATGGHILVEGPPGTGKTTVARLFSQAIGGRFRRIQMTPDLLPSDILGSYYYDLQRGEWVFREGAIFANVVVVDELNRAPPRTQSALIEAMQEGQVSVEGRTFPLERPFLVLATQVPVGEEGTYQLTQVLADRFAYYYSTSYPRPEDEVLILDKSEEIEDRALKPVMSPREALEAQRAARKVYVAESVKKYIVSLVNRVRESEEVLWGPSPRASIWLYRGSRALALIEGMDYVLPDHVKRLARNVIPHRVGLKPEYEVEGFSPLRVVERVLGEVEVPKA